MMRWIQFKCGNVIDISIYLKIFFLMFIFINNMAWIDWKCMLEMNKLKKKTDLPKEVWKNVSQ